LEKFWPTWNNGPLCSTISHIQQAHKNEELNLNLEPEL
jgi:hypothetical protein